MKAKNFEMFVGIWNVCLLGKFVILPVWMVH